MKNVLDFIINNWEWLAVVLYELVARLFPTSKNLSILDNALKFIGLIIKNRRRPQPSDDIQMGIKGGNKAKNKVWVDVTKHIIPILFMFCFISSQAQNNAAVKAVYAYNADSATVRAVTSNLNDTYSGLAGALYYNTDAAIPKWRIFEAGEWKDLVNEGSGNISGTLTAPGVPYTTAANTLATDENWFSYFPDEHLLVSGYLTLDPSPDGTGGAALNLGSLTTSPVSPDEGDMWYNANENTFYVQDNGTRTLITNSQIQTLTNKTFSSNTSFVSTPTITAKFIFNPGSSNAGINVGATSVDPTTTLLNGDLWYNSSTNQLKARINGSTISLGAGLQTASQGLTAVGSDVQLGGTLTGGALKQITSTEGNGVAFSMSSGTPEFSYFTVTPNFVNMQHRESTGVITYKYELNDTGGTFEGDHVFMQGANTALSIKDVSSVIQIVMPNLPTSSAGLPSGCLWNNAGVLSVAP